MPKFKCPCGRPYLYENCCGKIHQEITLAETAEDLMRSRYSAFVLTDMEYLLKSHHPIKRSKVEIEEVEKWTKSVKWLGLEIINKSAGNVSDTEGTVEFKAHFKQGLKHSEIHENSKFVKINGCWVYYDAIK